MKTKLILSVFGLLFSTLFSKNVVAQTEKPEVIIKEVAPLKSEKESQEIIIRKKGNKDTKVTLEITDGKIIINGKPLAEFSEEGMTINNRKIIIKEGNKITMNIDEDAMGRLELLDDLDMGEIQSLTIDKMNRMDFNGFGEGAVSKPFLGVVTEKCNDGAKIMSVEKASPAEKAGLLKDDVIYKVGDKKVSDTKALSEIIGEMKVDEKATVYFLREGKKKEVNATLGEHKNKFSINKVYAYQTPEGKLRSLTIPRKQNRDIIKEYNYNNKDWDNNFKGSFLLDAKRPKLGIKIQDTEDENGVKILEIEAASASANAGLLKDDVVTEIGGVKVNNTDDAREQLRENANKASYNIKANRAGKEMDFTIKIPKKLKTANL
jgi:serine protease Do